MRRQRLQGRPGHCHRRRRTRTERRRSADSRRPSRLIRPDRPSHHSCAAAAPSCSPLPALLSVTANTASISSLTAPFAPTLSLALLIHAVSMAMIWTMASIPISSANSPILPVAFSSATTMTSPPAFAVPSRRPNSSISSVSLPHRFSKMASFIASRLSSPPA